PIWQNRQWLARSEGGPSGGCDRFLLQHILRRGRRHRACSRHLWSVVKLQEHSWSLFLRHKRVRTARACPHARRRSRTDLQSKFNRRNSFTARENTSFVRVVESRRRNRPRMTPVSHCERVSARPIFCTISAETSINGIHFSKHSQTGS